MASTLYGCGTRPLMKRREEVIKVKEVILKEEKELKKLSMKTELRNINENDAYITRHLSTAWVRRCISNLAPS
jgi:hypothetical protein